MLLWFYGCAFETGILWAANFQYSLGHEKDFSVLSSVSTINNEIFVFVPFLVRTESGSSRDVSGIAIWDPAGK